MTTAPHWERIDWPILKATYELELERRERGRRTEYIEGTAIGERAGVGHTDMAASLENLVDAGFVIGDAGLSGVYDIRRVTPRGLQALGEWPSADALAEVLPQLLERLAANADHDEEADALRRGADVLQGVATGTITALLRQVLGLG